jgi:hypothetical protein
MRLVRQIAVVVLGALSGLGAGACGARVGAPQPECHGPDLLFTPIDGMATILDDGLCIFEENQDGREHRVVCDSEGCLWYVDGTLTCTCEQLDYANTCTNGVPMCADWYGHFDFSGP